MTLRARLGHGDRHRRARRRGALRRAPSPSWRAACCRSATSCAPTRSWPSASGASSRSRTPPATGCARSSTPTRRSRSSAGWSSARRARWRSSPRRCSRRVPLGRRAHDGAGCTSPASTPRVAPVPALVAAGARAVELMVAPALIAAAWHIARHAARTGASCRPSRPRCSSSSAATTTAELDALRGARARACSRARAARARRASRATPRRSSWPGACARACSGCVGQIRPPGTSLIIEDVCVPPERDRRVRAQDLQALLGKHGFLPGVAGHASAGNLHFLLTPDFGEPEDRERYEAFMGELVDADRRQVRRLAEGRARDRAQHGAVRRARVGREGDRDDVADQGARRPGRRARTRASCSTATPSVHLRNLKRSRRSRRSPTHVRRVRLLRAGLPEPRR